LSSVTELAKVLTVENASDVLPRFFGLSSREAAVVAASIRPVANPPEREVATSLSPRKPADAQPSTPAFTTGDAPVRQVRAPELPAANATAPAPTAPRLAGPEAIRDDAEPLDADRVRLHVTISRRLLAKMRR
jgi:hypothetical protein